MHHGLSCSLQSDTSVDSEDSFASVIFVPKADQFMDPLGPKTPSPTLCTSAPASPLLGPQPSSPKVPKVLLYSGQHSPGHSPQLPSSPRLGPLMIPVPVTGDPLPIHVPVLPALPGHGPGGHLGKDHDGRLQQIKEMLRQKNGK